MPVFTRKELQDHFKRLQEKISKMEREGDTTHFEYDYTQFLAGKIAFQLLHNA